MPDRRSVDMNFCYEYCVKMAHSCAQKQWITLWISIRNRREPTADAGFPGLPFFWVVSTAVQSKARTKPTSGRRLSRERQIGCPSTVSIVGIFTESVDKCVGRGWANPSRPVSMRDRHVLPEI